MIDSIACFFVFLVVIILVTRANHLKNIIKGTEWPTIKERREQQSWNGKEETKMQQTTEQGFMNMGKGTQCWNKNNESGLVFV